MSDDWSKRECSLRCVYLTRSQQAGPGRRRDPTFHVWQVRHSRRQHRSIFLCNDVLLYAARPTNPGHRGQLLLKNKIWLRDGARVHQLPSTEATPYAFAVVARGKAYTWLADSMAECKEWVEAISGAIDECAA